MGKLFVIDGTDGSGKQTQFMKLQESLTKDGIDYKVVSFPNYNSPSSSLVKMYLSGEFGKNAKYLRPVRKGPFYAMRVFCAGYDTIGGIKVNGKMQVVKEDGKAIPGLYAAGDNMMSEFYGNPPTGGSAGAYFAMPFGFAAGDSACDYMEKHA